MKDFLFVCGITLLALLFTIGIVKVVIKPLSDTPPTDTTVRLITAEPQFYIGKRVKISSGGFQPGLHPNILVYRFRADLPPILICIFEKTPIEPYSKFIIGNITKTEDGVTTMTNCMNIP